MLRNLVMKDAIYCGRSAHFGNIRIWWSHHMRQHHCHILSASQSVRRIRHPPYSPSKPLISLAYVCETLSCPTFYPTLQGLQVAAVRRKPGRVGGWSSEKFVPRLNCNGVSEFPVRKEGSVVEWSRSGFSGSTGGASDV